MSPSRNVTQTCVPSATGVELAGVLFLCIFSAAAVSTVFRQSTLPSVRSKQSSTRSLVSGTNEVRKTRPPETTGDECPIPGTGDLPDDVLGRAPRHRDGRVVDDAVAVRPAEDRPVGAAECGERGTISSEYDEASHFLPSGCASCGLGLEHLGLHRQCRLAELQVGLRQRRFFGLRAASSLSFSAASSTAFSAARLRSRSVDVAVRRRTVGA